MDIYIIIFILFILILLRKIEKEKHINKKIPYKEYLKTKHWRRTRNKALVRYNFQCAICGSGKNLNVHHKTYANLWNEKPEDLVVLCNYHHKLVHNKK